MLFGQQATGRIVGRIVDSQGAVIVGAKITVTNAGTHISSETVTDKDGAYQVLQLPIGDYSVTVEKSGFQKTITTPHPLEINQALRVDLTLRVGAASETLEVSGAAALVETYNSTLGNSVTERPIINMPLNGRNVLDLAKLEPGVTDENRGHDGAGSFSVAGGRLDSVTYLLDGGSNNNLLDNGVVFSPNPDAVAEFRILESNYSAEYGRNAGGVVSVVTKSGTNNWHGSAFEFLRNDALNANSYFNKRQELPREVLKRNQFGGTFGGPIFKDKAFFFFGYQGQRLTQQQNPGQRTVWTDNEINGNFSQSAGASQVAAFLQVNPYFQSNPALAAQGIIDPTKINPVSKKYIAAGIIPHSASGFATPQASANNNFNEYTGKVDWNISPKDKLAVSLGMNRGSQLCPFAQDSCSSTSLQSTTPFPVSYAGHTYFLNLAYSRAFTPIFLNEFRFTAQRAWSDRYRPTVSLPTASQLGIGTTPDESTGPPMLYFYDSADWFGFSYRGPTTFANNTFSFNDTVSWVKGKHTLKFGFGYTPFQNNTLYDYYVNGEFDFYGSSGVGTGVEFADFLLGIPDEYYQWPSAPSNIRSKNFLAFAQDEWRVAKNLVLTLGLRYEYSSPKYDTQGRSFSLIPGQQSTRFTDAPVGLVFPGDEGAPDGANFPDKNDFAPRVGFAWDPFNNGRTSIRGGVGVFYDILKGEDSLQFNGQAPFFGYTDFNFDPPDYSGDIPYFSDPFGSTGTVNPFPSKPPPSNINFDDSGFLPFGGGGVYFVDTHLRTPYIYQYNLSIQQELGRSMRAEAAYVGSTSHKLTDLVDMNPFILGTADRVLNLQPGANSNTWSYIATFRNAGNQNYNGLILSLKKQPSKQRFLGTTYFTLAYTYSKNLDNASGFRQTTASVPYYQPGLFWGLSDIDIPHRVTFSGGWDLPFAEMWSSGPKKLTRGWSFYPIISWRGGFPLDVYANLVHNRRYPGPSGAGDSQLVRVNLVGNGVTTYDPKAKTDLSTMGAVYFNPSNFEWSSLEDLNGRFLVPTTSQRTYGTLGRHAFRGPSRGNFDFAIAKNTNITERVAMEFRTEFFNAFNSAQFDNPNTNPNSSLFGEITTTYDPRIIQFGLRLTF